MALHDPLSPPSTLLVVPDALATLTLTLAPTPLHTHPWTGDVYFLTLLSDWKNCYSFENHLIFEIFLDSLSPRDVLLSACQLHHVPARDLCPLLVLELLKGTALFFLLLEGPTARRSRVPYDSGAHGALFLCFRAGSQWCWRPLSPCSKLAMKASNKAPRCTAAAVLPETHGPQVHSAGWLTHPEKDV